GALDPAALWREFHGRRQRLARPRGRPAVRDGGPWPAAGIPPAPRRRVQRRRRHLARECLAGSRRHPATIGALLMADAEKGRPNQKSRTRKDLLRAAARLMKEGRNPSLEEIAEEALVSR